MNPMSWLRAPWLVVPASGLALLLVWEVIVQWSGVQTFVLPAPSQIAHALLAMLADGSLAQHFVVTLTETLAGFTLAAVAGLLLGGLIAEFSWIRRVVYPYIVALQTVPKIAIAPILVLWFGFGIGSKIVIAATVALFPILVNTIEGLSNADEGRIDLLRSLGGTRWQVFRMVKFPSALPFIFAGLGAGIVLSLLGAVVGEFVGARAGLGSLILQVNARLDTAAVFAILTVLGLIGITLNLLLRLVQDRVVFWTRPRRNGPRRTAASATGGSAAAPRDVLSSSAP